MSQITYKGIVTASLRDRTFRSRNEGKLELFKLLAQFLCSSADNISSKFDHLPGYVGIRKISIENGQKKITNLLYRDVIISAGFSTIANCLTFTVTTVLLAVTSFYIRPSTSLAKRNGSFSAPVF